MKLKENFEKKIKGKEKTFGKVFTKIKHILQMFKDNFT